jgi:UDP-glucose 4-epimerase
MGVLITGGMGYIGSRVAAKLPGSYVIDHKAGNDIDFYTLDEYLPYCDTVIHLAGSSSFTAEDCYSDLATFILLMKGMKYHNIKRLILGSSAAVYGNAEGIVDETVKPNPTTPYGRYKLMCEQIAQDYGMETVILRPFNASGGLAKFIPNVKSGKVTIFGDGNAVRDFVHVDDVADAFVKALESPPDVFNIGSGVGHRLNEVIALWGNVEVEYKYDHKNDPTILIADISKAKKLLKWKPKYSIWDILNNGN